LKKVGALKENETRQGTYGTHFTAISHRTVFFMIYQHEYSFSPWPWHLVMLWWLCNSGKNAWLVNLMHGWLLLQCKMLFLHVGQHVIKNIGPLESEHPLMHNYNVPLLPYCCLRHPLHHICQLVSRIVPGKHNHSYAYYPIYLTKHVIIAR
jgi:hypothetical protein